MTKIHIKPPFLATSTKAANDPQQTYVFIYLGDNTLDGMDRMHMMDGMDGVGWRVGCMGWMEQDGMNGIDGVHGMDGVHRMDVSSCMVGMDGMDGMAALMGDRVRWLRWILTHSLTHACTHSLTQSFTTLS